SLKFMHVCGTHQDTLMKHGLDSLFSQCGVTIIQGPGCPVCVTTPREIEEMILLARNGKTVATFGDMLQVPGETCSLLDLRGEGCDIRTVYGIEDAVEIARKEKDKEVVFMAIGFETTAPSTASVIVNQPPENFSILCCHRLIPPALDAILSMGEIRLDGLIEPGHVSTIIGIKPYESLTKTYGIPQVIAGFEPLDLVVGVWMLINQIENGEPKVENEYIRVVREEGNLRAQQLMREVFITKDVRWRGFPVIPNSGFKLRDKYQEYDARIRYEEELSKLSNKTFREPPGCRCGELLRGLITPEECPLFGKKCTPTHPVGPCMVSIEGSCRITLKYSRKNLG
ncbi:MAG TPA: hydrogenase formation protein HypD, partial [Thermoplasmatales archaeon]|nr:hydrogenase formation protein HypD [Thermoplasmatales archaeon]